MIIAPEEILLHKITETISLRDRKRNPKIKL